VAVPIFVNAEGATVVSVAPVLFIATIVKVATSPVNKQLGVTVKDVTRKVQAVALIVMVGVVTVLEVRIPVLSFA
jgi:hypothetical protein